MNNYEKFLLSPNFKYVYIEDDVQDHPVTREILSKLHNPQKITIKHYKDVFCRKNQDFAMQKESVQIILAKKRTSFLYKGSRMCDSFGNENFMYCADIMNCVYQCEYCYLQGMYQSANLVIFVNLEDTFAEIERQLTNEPMYLCISYDTDLLAIENITGFVAKWIEFARGKDGLTIELRTKSANFNSISKFDPPQNIMLAWSISPSKIIQAYEHKTPSLNSRLNSMNQAIEMGWKVRLIIDPMIHTNDWKTQYSELADLIKKEIQIDKLPEMSVGVFRVPKENLKIMRGIYPNSKLLAYPFTLSESGWSYTKEQCIEMQKFMEYQFKTIISE